jgi:hypothetical protein
VVNLSPLSVTQSEGDTTSDAPDPRKERLRQIALWIKAAGDEFKPIGPAPGDSPLRLDPRMCALQESLTRLRQRVEYFEANPQIHEWDASAPCARLYCQSDPFGIIRPSNCWADDVDDETMSDKAEE